MMTIKTHLDLGSHRSIRLALTNAIPRVGRE